MNFVSGLRRFRLGPYLFRRSIYDRTRLAQVADQWDGDDLRPADGRGLSIVEIDEGERDDGSPCVTFSTTDIGPSSAIVIDWPEARRDPGYASDMLLMIEGAYHATGYIEGDFFCTLIDRLSEYVRGSIGVRLGDVDDLS